MVARPDADVFAALADNARPHIIEALQQRSPLSTTALAASTGKSRQSVRKHLDVLAAAGLVHDNKVGRTREWTLDAAPLEEVRTWSQHVYSTWSARFDRLDAFLQSTAPGEPDVP